MSIKRIVIIALCLALLLACGCTLQKQLFTMTAGDMTYEYECFFDSEQETAEYRMACARIKTVAAPGEEPQPVTAALTEKLFDDAGLTLTVDGVDYPVTTMVTKFNTDGTFEKLDFGAEVPANTPNNAEIVLKKN